MLAVYHATWEGGSTTKIQDEVKHIPEVFAAMAAARPDEKDLLMVGFMVLVVAVY